MFSFIFEKYNNNLYSQACRKKCLEWLHQTLAAFIWIEELWVILCVRDTSWKSQQITGS